MVRPYQGRGTHNLLRPRGHGDSRKDLEDRGDLLSSGLSYQPTTGELDTLPSVPWQKSLNQHHPDIIQRTHRDRWPVRFRTPFPGRTAR